MAVRRVRISRKRPKNVVSNMLPTRDFILNGSVPTYTKKVFD